MNTGEVRGYGSGQLTLPLMFLSSYAPLLVIFAVRFDDLRLRIGCLFFALVGICGLWLLVRHNREPDEHQQGRHTFTSVRGAGEGASSYLAGYLLPFVTISNPSPNDLVAYAVFFVVAYVVTARTGIIQVNPTLFLAGYRVDSVTDTLGAHRYLLSKSEDLVVPGVRIRASRMTNDVLIFEGVDRSAEQ